jgi:hypothetical protein
VTATVRNKHGQVVPARWRDIVYIALQYNFFFFRCWMPSHVRLAGRNAGGSTVCAPCIVLVLGREITQYSAHVLTLLGAGHQTCLLRWGDTARAQCHCSWCRGGEYRCGTAAVAWAAWLVGTIMMVLLTRQPVQPMQSDVPTVATSHGKMGSLPVQEWVRVGVPIAAGVPVPLPTSICSSLDIWNVYGGSESTVNVRKINFHTQSENGFVKQCHHGRISHIL